MATDPSSLINSLLNSGGLIGQSFNQGMQQANQNAQSQLATGIDALKLQTAMQQWKDDKSWGDDVAAYNKNPDVSGLVALAVKHPGRADMLQQLWKLKDEDQAKGDLTQFGEIYALAGGKDPAPLIDKIQKLRTATANANGDPSEFDDMISSLQQGGQAAMNSVKGLALAHLAASGSAANGRAPNMIGRL